MDPRVRKRRTDVNYLCKIFPNPKANKISCYIVLALYLFRFPLALVYVTNYVTAQRCSQLLSFLGCVQFTRFIDYLAIALSLKTIVWTLKTKVLSDCYYNCSVLCLIYSFNWKKNVNTTTILGFGNHSIENSCFLSSAL